MTIPTSSNISVSSMNTEVGLASNEPNSSVRARATTFGFSTPDSFAEFGGWSYINCYFGGVTWESYSTYYHRGYRTVFHETQPSGSIVAMQFYWSLGANQQGNSQVWWSRNSTSSWNSLGVNTNDGFMSGTYSITNIVPSDVIRVRTMADLYDTWDTAARSYIRLNSDPTISPTTNNISKRTGTYTWTNSITD